MALPSYADETMFQARVNTGVSMSASQVAVVVSMMTAISRLIDQFCRRKFYAEVAVTRYFDSDHSMTLVLPEDMSAVTSIATDEDGDGIFERTWAATDYYLAPVNAPSFEKPYTEIRVEVYGTKVFPYGRRRVRVTGNAGWPAVPQQVVEVTLLEAERLLGVSKSPTGVVANEGMGTATTVPALHPTSKMMLMPLRRMRIGVARGR